MFRTIAFIFDMNYNESLKIIKDSKELEYKFNLLSKFYNKEIKELQDICNKYIDERIDENVRS